MNPRHTELVECWLWLAAFAAVLLLVEAMR